MLNRVLNRRTPLRAVRRIVVGAALTLSLVGAGLVTAAQAETSPSAPQDKPLYLVTLTGPGVAGYDGPLPRQLERWQLTRDQDLLLEDVGAGAPLYRWTTALNGFAVRLTREQAETLAARPQVALIEKNAIRRLAGTPAAPAGRPSSGPSRGGAGTVIGIVDSGIWPRSPLFSAVPGLGRSPRDFTGECEVGQGWTKTTCNRKLVGARWFVDGYGAGRLRSTATLSPLDDDGHGTQMASIAAGNADVSVRVRGQKLGSYGGAAPQARLAVYKACWTAPDPRDDGCATADLVTAIDRATSDGVDVLNLSVGGPGGVDTVERALLGAAEADIVVVAAAGNDPHASAAHASPWVTTVGATTGATRRGAIALGSGATVTGAMSSTRAAGPSRVVLGARVPAPGSTPAQARLCEPGSLDAARVAGTIVLCERGGIGRVDKSAAVRRADGIGMILANVRPGSIDADFHSVPTVHLTRTDAQRVRTWLAGHPRGEVSLRPLGVQRPPARLLRASALGDPNGLVIKPDVVAPGQGVLGAVPPSGRSTRWDFVSGTSASAAYLSGAAAALVNRSGWSASAVRSALTTTADPLGGSVLRTGSGRVRPSLAGQPGLVYAVESADYRRWFNGDLRELNTPSILMAGDRSKATRTITNVGRRAMYFSSSTHGFTRYAVSVTPAAARLAPGESATFTIRVQRGSGALPMDDGFITWRGANGTASRIPVLITR